MRDSSQQQSPSEVVAALSDLILYPVQTVYHSWNRKAALLRAPLLLIATLRQGPLAVSIAVFAEAVYSAAISGCYDAVVQKLRRAHPLCVSGVLILVIFPGLLLWFDYLLHLYTGMSNLTGGMLAAASLSVLSSLFNWYLMSRDSLLVGKEGRSFASDHSGGFSTFYMAMLQVANQQQWEMRLVVPGAEDGVERVGRYGRICTISAPTALAHRWDCAALAYFSLYDAIHAEFRAGDTLAGFPPHAWSTPATTYADAVIAASSAMAQTLYRAVVHFGLQSPRSKIPSPRYMQMVPSVTGREEKSAVTLHPRRAD
jgi:hypothetical protein